MRKSTTNIITGREPWQGAGVSDRDLRRVVIASLIGATIEWYDFFLYGMVAGIVFNKLYFPVGDALISTMLAYTTFAVASSHGRSAA